MYHLGGLSHCTYQRAKKDFVMYTFGALVTNYLPQHQVSGIIALQVSNNTELFTEDVTYVCKFIAMAIRYSIYVPINTLSNSQKMKV